MGKDISSPATRKRLDNLGAALAAEPVIQNMLQDMEHHRQQDEKRAAAKDSVKHRLSRTMADGKPASYQYYVVKSTKSSEHRWCYASWKNVAGYYLVWYEIETKAGGKRSKWNAELTRKDARALAKRLAKI